MGILEHTQKTLFSKTGAHIKAALITTPQNFKKLQARYIFERVLADDKTHQSPGQRVSGIVNETKDCGLLLHTKALVWLRVVGFGDAEAAHFYIQTLA